MKVGDAVRCITTQQVGLIVGRAVYQSIEWGYQVLFSDGIREENGGYLEVIDECG